MRSVKKSSARQVYVVVAKRGEGFESQQYRVEKSRAKPVARVSQWSQHVSI